MGRIPGFINGSYTLQTVNLDCQRCINLFPQINEGQGSTDGEIGSLVMTPGLRLLGTCGSGPIRGMYVTSTGGMCIVSGSEVYRVGLNWTFTLVGTLLTNSGAVSMADNGTQLIIVDGANGYIVSLSTGTFTQITDAGFPGGNTVCFQDGYFIVNNPGTGQFCWSNAYDGLTWDALNFVTAEGSPDATVAIVVNQRQVWAMGSRTVEVWWDSGADTTFSRIDGAFIEYGCIAPQTALKFSNTVAWVGAGPNANGVVWMAVGYQPKRISNHAVENAIQNYGDISTATAWTYQENGHAFYCLNFPNANTTWVYDMSTGLWHERAYLGSDGNLQRHRAGCYTFGFQTHVVGDYANANIYALDDSVYTDNGTNIVRLRRAPHLSADGKRMFFTRFQLMCRVGSGLDGAVTYATDPTVELRYSDDFGNSWCSAKPRSLGQIGIFDKRVIWDRLGSARNRVFEIRITDPVPVAILGAELTATPGAA